MSDVLALLSPAQVARFYQRLADQVDRNRGNLEVSVAALLMRQWLKNRNRHKTFVFNAPDHLRNHPSVLDALKYHRSVYLTEERARLTDGAERWVGLLPRLQGQSSFPKWNGKVPLTMDYQCLVEVPITKQLTGNDADKDILYSLHGFQLKTMVSITADTALGTRSRLRVRFQCFEAEVHDTYDWNYSEHLTVPNPDFGSTSPDAVTPKSQTVKVFHSNAKRVEDAGLAAPYELITERWRVTDARLMAAADIDPMRRP